VPLFHRLNALFKIRGILKELIYEAQIPAMMIEDWLKHTELIFPQSS
jgi:hypothetical protein